MEWIFSPFAAERKVHGMLVRCRVPMFEKFSVPFEFGADWLTPFDGKLVRLHFNPRNPKCAAKIVLLENCPGGNGLLRRSGDTLGDAKLIGETAAHVRFILDWADDDQRAGYLARQRVANFVRRETRGIGVGGRVEYSKSERRDGLGEITTIEREGQRPEPVEDEQTQVERRLAQNLSTDPAEATTRRAAKRMTLQEWAMADAFEP